MGMNYYLHKKSCFPQSDHYEINDTVQELTNGYVFENTYYSDLEQLNEVFFQKLHIGKKSAGWNFLLCCYPEYGINGLPDWIPLVYQYPIFDEYGEQISPEEMLSIIKTQAQRHTPDQYISYQGSYDIINDPNFS